MSYERIPYASFMWKFGTTSFRTKEFNYMTEKQLALLNAFWKIPENANQGWEKSYMAEGQKDIYEIKVKYYDYLVENKFMEGGESYHGKYKTAREKTSGLYDMGLVNENHRLTAVGRYLMELVGSQRYDEKTPLGISQDSQLYLGQLLKLSLKISGKVVRPLIVVLYLLSKLDFLTYDEFRYLVPLCVDENTTTNILNAILQLRNGERTIDDIMKTVLLSKPNYEKGLTRFRENAFSEELLLSVGMNRKSANYDKAYVTLYDEMYAVYMRNDGSRIVPLFNCLKGFQSSIAIKWKQLMFDTPLSAKLKQEPRAHLLQLPNGVTNTDYSFKEFFFLTMHLYKAKVTLEDYLDLNRRYLGLTNCFIFDDEQVKLDIVPKQFFNTAIKDLYKQAYENCALLEEMVSMDAVCPTLVFDEKKILDGINGDLGTSLTSMEEAYNEVDRLRYDRFNNMVNCKFSDGVLLKLLEDFNSRNDEEITGLVTDNADVPTIFEYVLGIIWYKVSGRRGRVLDFLKLSLDANLLPVTHAAGGEADIVWEYEKTKDYPQHSLLLEATLADSTNQRRMEMEPVSRHLGNHLLRTGNLNSYCVFATSYLHINVIGDFMNRKSSVYCDVADSDKYIEGMKIIPLDTKDLKEIINKNLTYSTLYKHFQKAYEANERHPQKWYDKYVTISNIQ